MLYGWRGIALGFVLGIGVTVSLAMAAALMAIVVVKLAGWFPTVPSAIWLAGGGIALLALIAAFANVIRRILK